MVPIDRKTQHFENEDKRYGEAKTDDNMNN